MVDVGILAFALTFMELFISISRAQFKFQNHQGYSYCIRLHLALSSRSGLLLADRFIIHILLSTVIMVTLSVFFIYSTWKVRQFLLAREQVWCDNGYFSPRMNAHTGVMSRPRVRRRQSQLTAW